MQTFAPYPDIDRCASVLDGARLEALTFPDTGFPSWWGDSLVHWRYRSLLRAKLPDWYRPRLPVEEDVPFDYPIPMLSRRKNR